MVDFIRQNVGGFKLRKAECIVPYSSQSVEADMLLVYIPCSLHM